MIRTATRLIVSGPASLPPASGTDDSFSIQAAMDANPGGTVVVPEGTYLVTTLTIPSLGITLVGEGPGSIIKQLPSASHMIFWTGTSGLVQLIGLTIDGNQQNQTTTAQTSLRLIATDTTSDNPSRFVIRNCQFINGRDTDIGIFAPDTSTVRTYVEVKDSFFLGGRDPGRYVYCQGTINALVEGNTLDYTGPHVVAGRSGIVFDDFGSDGTATNRGTATVANNYLRNCGTGILAAIGAIDFYSGFSQITVSGNRIIEPWGRGINVKADASAVTITGNTVVGLNETVAGGKSSQIILLGSVSAIVGKGNVVADNVCIDSGHDAISIFGNAVNAGAEFKHNMLAANNVVINPARRCFYLYECDTAEIKGNSTRGGETGLYAIQTHDHLVVSGNTFDRPTSHAMQIQGTVGLPDCVVTVTGNQAIEPGGRGVHVAYASECGVIGNTLDVTGNAPIYLLNITGTRTVRDNLIKSDTAVFITDATNTGSLYTDFLNSANQSFSLSYPDSTVTGGNPRGTRAVDLQQSRSASTQVANGLDSWLIGSANTASATNAGGLGVGNISSATTAISLGSTNIADGVSSLALGFRANTKGRYGFRCYASGRFGTNTGDAQSGEAILRATTTSTASTRLTSDGAAAGAANIVNLISNTAVMLNIDLVVFDQVSKDGASFQVQGVLMTKGAGAGLVAISGAPVFVKLFGTAGFAAIAVPTIAADTTNAGLNISVVALGTNATHWVASVKVTEVQ